MIQKLALILLVFFFNILTANAQMDVEAREAIATLLLSKPIADKVFVTYPEGAYQGPFQLSAGTYAFIPPNTTFRTVYPTILEEMPYSIDSDGLVDMKKLYADSSRGIYISMVPGFELFTVFQKIEVRPDTICMEFITTSGREKKIYNDKYVKVNAILIKRHEKWVITTCDIKKIAWTNYFKR